MTQVFVPNRSSKITPKMPKFSQFLDFLTFLGPPNDPLGTPECPGLEATPPAHIIYHKQCHISRFLVSDPDFRPRQISKNGPKNAKIQEIFRLFNVPRAPK